MNEKDLLQLYKTLVERARIDRPTYLTNYQMFKSFILNIKDDRFFNRKQYSIVSKEKYVRETNKNRLIFEEIINWILQGQLTKHRDRINNVMQKKITGRVDLLKISMNYYR